MLGFGKGICFFLHYLLLLLFLEFVLMVLIAQFLWGWGCVSFLTHADGQCSVYGGLTEKKNTNKTRKKTQKQHTTQTKTDKTKQRNKSSPNKWAACHHDPTASHWAPSSHVGHVPCALHSPWCHLYISDILGLG